MSALGRKRTLKRLHPMSALPLKTDVVQQTGLRNVIGPIRHTVPGSLWSVRLIGVDLGIDDHHQGSSPTGRASRVQRPRPFRCSDPASGSTAEFAAATSQVGLRFVVWGQAIWQLPDRNWVRFEIRGISESTCYCCDFSLWLPIPARSDGESPLSGRVCPFAASPTFQ
jgi:hypothetical protein